MIPTRQRSAEPHSALLEPPGPMSPSDPAAARRFDRQLCDFRGERAAAGPSLIVVAGLHGNEPAGVLALLRVSEIIQQLRLPVTGRFTALAGNLTALEAGRRFVDRDLNRAWQAERVAALRSGATPTSVEDLEQAALMDALAPLLESTQGEHFVLDLHTTSSCSAPFILFSDTLPNRRFARHFQLPLILGLEEQVDGAMLDYVEARHRLVTMGVEGGQHDDPASVDNLESVLWVALVTAGCLDAADLPDLEAHRQRLAAARADLPRVLEVRHRHAIGPDEAFRMEPGFANFEPVKRGQLLATNRGGSVLAGETARVLMPLYQGQGDDGFFLTRPVRPFWLRVSEALRQHRVGRILPLLPGVREHTAIPHTLVIDTGIAKLFPMQILHLLGYRKQRWDAGRLVVSRRVGDGLG